MTTTREKLAAIDKLARLQGLTREQVLKAVLPEMGLDAPEYQLLREAMARTPEPLAPAVEAERSAARTAATTRANEMQREADAQAINLWRQYREAKHTNPFVAARLLNSYGDEVFRGKALDSEPTDEGPQAA